MSVILDATRVVTRVVTELSFAVHGTAWHVTSNAKVHRLWMVVNSTRHDVGRVWMLKG